MDYKELIGSLRLEALRQGRKFGLFTLAIELNDAATAIRDLLEERDAIIEASRGDCNFCAHADRGVTAEPCVSCAYGLGMYDCWQWRGPQKEGGSDG